MTYNSFPFNDQSTTEADYSRLMNTLAGGSGVLDDLSAGMSVGLNTDNATLRITRGFAVVRGHAIHVTADENLPFERAPLRSARTDLVVLRLNPSQDSITPTVLKGADGGTAPPAPTQTEDGIYDLPLATLDVKDGALPVINLLRPRLPLGIGAWTNFTRPTSGVRRGHVGWNATTGGLEMWDGAAWTDVLSPVPGRSRTTLGAPANGRQVRNTSTGALLQGDGAEWRLINPATMPPGGGNWNASDANVGSARTFLTDANVVDPGHPYRLSAVVACELGSVNPGTRWDLHLRVEGSQNYGLDLNIPSTELVSWQRVNSIIGGPVLRGNARVIAEAVRAYGTSGGRVTRFNRQFLTYVHAA